MTLHMVHAPFIFHAPLLVHLEYFYVSFKVKYDVIWKSLKFLFADLGIRPFRLLLYLTHIPLRHSPYCAEPLLHVCL